ncbi:hypothetical protein ACUH78_04205 [Thauera sp. ZXT1-4]|uniref:hypothetical protein n=1 Tax=Thauera sp. ZXT1-4 TaxID=3460294 RepID=UPI004040C1C5
MSKLIAVGGIALGVLLVIAPAPGFAQQALEGKVVGSKLTHCDFKPGGCAGSLKLQTATGEVEIDVPLGTPIRQGSEYVYLPTLRGKVVSVVLAADKPGKTARSIDVKAVKP